MSNKLFILQKADLAVCDFTITEDRKKVVDFSVPFMSLGISILYTQDRKVKPGMFSFLNPYTFEVWMHTATAYFLVSMVLFICARYIFFVFTRLLILRRFSYERILWYN